MEQLVYFLATEVCDNPLRGAELDLLNDLVASAVMSILRFIDDFRRRAEAAPVIPGTAGEREFVPLIRELMEQGNRSVPPECVPESRFQVELVLLLQPTPR